MAREPVFLSERTVTMVSNYRADLMHDEEMIAYAVGEEEYSLKQLHYWLKYECLSSGLIFGAFWVPYQLIVTVLFYGAFIFTPYLLWHLTKAGWYKSIIVFLVIVVLPYGMSRFMDADLSLTRYLFSSVPLVSFYIFTWVLRLVVGEDLSERAMVRELTHRRRTG